MPKSVRIVGEKITMDLLLWREHGPQGLDLLVEALEMNPGKLDAYLPSGQTVLIPDLPTQTVREKKIITLFD